MVDNDNFNNYCMDSLAKKLVVLQMLIDKIKENTRRNLALIQLLVVEGAALCSVLTILRLTCPPM